MKKIFIMALSAILLLGACDDKLDIVPKGQTTLSTVDDLELLLNQEYGFEVDPYSDLGLICNESLCGMLANVQEILSQPNTLNYANLAYDESVDRATLAQNDARYEGIYKYVNYMNVILDKIDDAEGDASRKPAIKAQAKVIRAYLHYLAVNIYAAQYDDATAATEGGIAYVDDADASTQKPKLTIKEVYDKMLADCSDETIAQLPAQASDAFHASQATGYAIRAKILFQMKHYAEALPYAEKALGLNNKIEDRSKVAENMSWKLDQDSPNNLLAIKGVARGCPMFETISAETATKFEEGDYVKQRERFLFDDASKHILAPFIQVLDITVFRLAFSQDCHHLVMYTDIHIVFPLHHALHLIGSQITFIDSILHAVLGKKRKVCAQQSIGIHHQLWVHQAIELRQFSLLEVGKNLSINVHNSFISLFDRLPTSTSLSMWRSISGCAVSQS